MYRKRFLSTWWPFKSQTQTCKNISGSPRHARWRRVAAWWARDSLNCRTDCAPPGCSRRACMVFAVCSWSCSRLVSLRRSSRYRLRRRPRRIMSMKRRRRWESCQICCIFCAAHTRLASNLPQSCKQKMFFGEAATQNFNRIVIQNYKLSNWNVELLLLNIAAGGAARGRWLTERRLSGRHGIRPVRRTLSWLQKCNSYSTIMLMF